MKNKISVQPGQSNPKIGRGKIQASTNKNKVQEMAKQNTVKHENVRENATTNWQRKKGACGLKYTRERSLTRRR